MEAAGGGGGGVDTGYGFSKAKADFNKHVSGQDDGTRMREGSGPHNKDYPPIRWP